MTEEQLQRIIAALAPANRQGSFARCNAVYDGTGDNETVETFLSAIKVYKKIENIDDENALEGLTLLLKGDAAVWWEGAKSDVKSWTDFEDRLRHAFAPKIPADILYQKIIELKQDATTPTEKFVAKKRALIAQLPAPIPSETISYI
ncbi:activity-regulated cytoskeleton associated protein 2-like [Leguminivora glycinivorella]|uniref:activity-regulated cytoskeleton associated protein 2-like n=1 Tax=Leguminivora glycinivorella TaxID=1035111 RepID=UPI00200D2EBC|nr:activity-regulated cytoskeleton associated protein 2-like [Leguminivora glycinivorella]